MMIKKCIQTIDYLLSTISVFLIRIYQASLSPNKGILRYRLKDAICSHEPHCSEYTKLSLERYGFFKGIRYGLERVTQCIPRYHKIYDPPFYKIIFFSGAPIGVPFLESIYKDKRFEIIGVVTMPDAPRGRGMKIKENIIKLKAGNLDLETKTPHSLRLNSKKYKAEAEEVHTRLKNKNPDFIVVVAYGKIIPQSILDIPYFGSINVHGSILPKYRGSSPLQSVFLHGEKKTGLTIMLMNNKLDEGDIIDIHKIPLSLEMTVQDLIQIFKEIGPRFLNNTLRKYAHGDLKPKKQEHKYATLCHKINKKDGEISLFYDTMETVINKYRAYLLRPKIYFFLSNKRIIIENISYDTGDIFLQRSPCPLFISQKHEKFHQAKHHRNTYQKRTSIQYYLIHLPFCEYQEKMQQQGQNQNFGYIQKAQDKILGDGTRQKHIYYNRSQDLSKSNTENTIACIVNPIVHNMKLKMEGKSSLQRNQFWIGIK